MGLVYKAENQNLGRKVALKVIAPDLAEDEAFLKRFRREARALAQLYHPHIVLVFALRQSELGLYIDMEYVEGKTLAAHLKASGPMEWPEALPLIKQLLSALQYAHERGVIHRDLKPRNIMLTEEGAVKVMDFGLAKMLEQGSGETTVTAARAGTLCYMSPEQARGLKNVDQRSDLFSLGLTLYEVLAGRLPFKKDESDFSILKAIVEKKFPSPHTFNPALPRRLSKILMKALEKNPEKRYQSAAEMLAALEAFEAQEQEAGEATFVVPPVLPDRPRRAEARRTGIRLSLAAVAVVTLALVGYAFLPVWLGSSDSPGPEAEGAVAAVPIPEQQDQPEDPPATDEPAASTAEAPPDDQPAETEAVAPTGTLAIRSEPPGARIILDGAPRGTTPRTLAEVPAGRHSLVLRLDGHEAYTTTTTLDAQQQRTLNATLVALTGVLQVSVKPSGRLSIDGDVVREQVSGAAALDLPVGRRTVTVEHPEFGRWQREVVLSSETPAQVSVDFTRLVGVTIVAVDTEGNPMRGEIVVDGVSVGMSPRLVQVRVGLRRIEVRADGYVIDGAAPVINFEQDRAVPLQVTLRKQEQ